MKSVSQSIQLLRKIQNVRSLQHVPLLSIKIVGVSLNHGVLVSGVVLEISLSSFQTACLSRTFAVSVRWDLCTEFPVTLHHKFLGRSPIFLHGNQKNKGLHYISLTLSRNKSQWHRYSARCVCLVKRCSWKGAHPSSRENPEWFLETSETPLCFTLSYFEHFW